MSKQIKKFLAIYIGSVSTKEKSDTKIDPGEEKAGMEAWGKWVMENQKSIVDHGAPLGKTKRVNSKGISDMENRDAAYVIVQADSHDAAAKLFLNHPHFSIFPGDSVEVMECLPMD